MHALLFGKGHWNIEAAFTGMFCMGIRSTVRNLISLEPIARVPSEALDRLFLHYGKVFLVHSLVNIIALLVRNVAWIFWRLTIKTVK